MALIWFDVKFGFFLLLAWRKLFSMAWRAGVVWRCEVADLPGIKYEMAEIFALASKRAGLAENEIAEIKRRYLNAENS